MSHEKARKIPKLKDSSEECTWFCYILKNSNQGDENRTYNGKTNDLKRRITEHNCIKSSNRGAKYTRLHGNHSWEYMFVMSGFLDERDALRHEWRIKKPLGKNRTSKYCTPAGRIDGVSYALTLDKFTTKCERLTSECNFTIWILKEFADNLVIPAGLNIDVVYIETSFTDDIIDQIQNAKLWEKNEKK